MGGDIIVLTNDSAALSADLGRAGDELCPRDTFAADNAAIPPRSRFIDDADDWARCRALRLLMEDELARREDFELIDPDTASGIRADLSQIERQVGDMPVDRIMAGLIGVKKRLHDEHDERAFC